MSDFVVKIDTTKLNDKQAADVAGAIQGAVLRELARLDLAPPSGPTGAITFLNGVASGCGASGISKGPKLLRHRRWRSLSASSHEYPVPKCALSRGRYSARDRSP